MRLNDTISAVYPDDLLDTPLPLDCQRRWHAIYTKSRQEKSLARDLFGYRIPYYLPLVSQTKMYAHRRIVTETPLFASYVFAWCSDEERVTCLTTNRISRILPVNDAASLHTDLGHLQTLIAAGVPLTMEQRLVPGEYVRIKNGPLAGLEGTILMRRSTTRLLVAVNFLQQGASVEVEDFQLEPLGQLRPPPPRARWQRIEVVLTP